MVRELEADVFTTLPEELYHRGEPTEWAKEVRPGKRIHSFLEGPSFDRDGNLYVSDTPHGRIFRIDPEGKWETAIDYGGQPNGLAFHRDGRLFVADYERGILVIDLASGVVHAVTDGNFLGCSDLFFDSGGALYFTDADPNDPTGPKGSVYRWSPEDGLKLLFSGFHYPNGIALDPTETEVYVAVTRDNAVVRFPTGSQSIELFAQLSGGLGPDGLAFDAEGRLAVAHARNGRVWVVDRAGEPVHEISTPGQSVTNVAYDDRMLYITEADHGAILRVELDTPGLPLFSHR